jgi:hypothetical protein
MGVMFCAMAFAAPPQPGSPPQSPTTAPGAGAQGAGTPNDDFIEFLGDDDVGDAALWEFLKNSAPRKDPRPEPPPQDANQ